MKLILLFLLLISSVMATEKYPFKVSEDMFNECSYMQNDNLITNVECLDNFDQVPPLRSRELGTSITVCAWVLATVIATLPEEKKVQIWNGIEYITETIIEWVVKEEEKLVEVCHEEIVEPGGGYGLPINNHR